MGLLWLLLFGLMQILYAKILLMPDFPQGFIVKCSKDGKLLRSDSFGLSWKEVTPLVEQSPFVTSIASDSKGERLIAATKSAGVFLSSDSGMSWRQLNLPTELSWAAVASNQLGKRMIVASAEGSVFLSGDGGDSWQEAASVAPQRNSWTSVVSDRSGQYLALTSSNDGIYVSFDFGANWVKTDTPAPPRKWRDVTTDFSGQFLAAIAEDDSEAIYHSEDYGLTWRAVAVSGSGFGHRAWRAVASDHSGAFLSALTSDGVLYTSSNYGNEWRAVTSLPLTQRLSDTSFDEAQGVHLLALSDDSSGAFSSRDGGVTWQTHFSSLHTSSEEQTATSPEAFQSLFSGYRQGFFPQKVRQQLHALQAPPVENKVEASRANFDHLYNQFQDFLFSADVGSFDQEITGAPTYEPSAVPSPPPSPSPSKQPTPLPTAMPSAPFLDLTATSASRNYAVRNAYAFAAVDAQQGLWLWGGSQLAINETTHLLEAKEVVSSLYAYVIVLQSGEFFALGARTAIDGWLSYSSFKVVKVCASENAFAAITEEGGVIAFGSVGHGGVVSESLLPYLQSGVRGLVATAGAFSAWTSDGRVFCWGNKHTGGDVSSLSNAALRDVVQVFATRGAFAALTTSGDVITWGDCLRGGCQQGLTDVISIIAASSAFVALGGDYEVVAWGNPRYGGDLPTATKAAIGTSAAAIFHNVGAIAVLLSSGKVVTWGDAGYGGNSSAVSSLLVDVVNVTSTDRAFAALDRSGRVIVWGDGQFGGQIPSTLSAVTSEGVRSVVGSKAAFAAITASGEVVTWGDALFGADTSSVSSFIGQGVAAVQGNSGGFLAVNASGAVFMWGNKAVFEEEGLISHVTALPLQFFS